MPFRSFVPGIVSKFGAGLAALGSQKMPLVELLLLLTSLAFQPISSLPPAFDRAAFEAYLQQAFFANVVVYSGDIVP
jgi:hypothetical protein